MAQPAFFIDPSESTKLVACNGGGLERVQGFGLSDCNAEVSGRHILADSGVGKKALGTITAERFAVVDFHRCLAAPEAPQKPTNLETDCCMGPEKGSGRRIAEGKDRLQRLPTSGAHAALQPLGLLTGLHYAPLSLQRDPAIRALGRRRQPVSKFK
jgi:hypothetical protein